MIVVAALLFGHWLTETRMPARMIEFVTEIDLKYWQFLLLMNLSMILLGTVLEGLSIVLITVPLVLPLLTQFNIDPIHYAIIVVINIEIAMLTPPVGLNLICAFRCIWCTSFRGHPRDTTILSTNGDIANCSDIFTRSINVHYQTISSNKFLCIE